MLRKTKVTAAGVDELKKALPKCDVNWDSGAIDPMAANPTADAVAWERSLATLPAEDQVKAVGARLKHLNPDFDGKLTPTIENDIVTGLEFLSNKIQDISPIRALTQLTSLDCRGDSLVLGRFSDLRPLKGMQLKSLKCGVTAISDLTPLQGMPLTHLYFDNTNVSDLSPLEGMSLKELNCSYTQVPSLAPLKGMSLTVLWCNHTPITDLSPVKGMPLEWITIHATKVKDLSPLKGMPLTQIYLDFDSSATANSSAP